MEIVFVIAVCIAFAIQTYFTDLLFRRVDALRQASNCNAEAIQGICSHVGIQHEEHITGVDLFPLQK